MDDLLNGRLPYDWQKILGKTIPFRYPLVLHLLDTAAVSEKLWKNLLSVKQREQIMERLGNVTEAEALSFVKVLAGLHDIGKASPFWQQSTLKIRADDDSIAGLDFPEIGKGFVKHDVQGYLYADYKRKLYPNIDIEFYEFLKVTSLGHHGNFKSSDPEAYPLIRNLDNDEPVWFDQQKGIETAVKETIGFEPFVIKSGAHLDKVLVNLLEGIIILADWVASQSSFIKGLPVDSVYRAHFAAALDRAESFVIDNGLKAPRWVSKDLSWLDINPHITAPNDMQQKIVESIDEDTGFVFISAPMGNGKTEAAVYAASKMGAYADNGGIYFALPTQSTSDAMFERLVSSESPLGKKIFVDNYSVSLMHSNNLVARFLDRINRKSGVPTPPPVYADKAQIGDESYAGVAASTTDDSTQYISDFLMSKKLGGMSALSVGTIDSLLDVTVPLKHNALRWLAVSGKTVVIDEAHSFDSYTTELIKSFVSWCAEFSIPVICMTATMPEEDQKALSEAYIKGLFNDKSIPRAERKVLKNNALTGLNNLFEVSGIQSPGLLTISRSGDSSMIDCVSSFNTPDAPMYFNVVESGVKEAELAEYLADSVVERVEENLDSRVMRLVICNTINNAISVFEKIKAFGVECDLLHSKMPPLMKQRIVKKVLNKTGKNFDRLSSGQYVLVSTQLVESSLDIDFDEIHTQVAPIDSILQRLGRVYRHNNERPAEAKAEAFFYVSKDLNKLVETGAKSNKTFLPYSDWEMASSLSVIKTLQQDNPVKVKASIDRVFNLINGECSVKYEDLLKDFMIDSVGRKDAAGAGLVPISSDLNNMTSLYTAKSAKRVPVRMIMPTVSIIPFKNGKIVSENNGVEKLFVPPVFSYKDLKTYRLYADNSFTVYDWDFVKLNNSSKYDIVKELEKDLNLPEYIKIVFVDDIIYSVGDKGFGLDMRGLAKQ